MFHFDPVAANNAGNAAALAAGLVANGSSPQLLQLGIGNVPGANGAVPNGQVASAGNSGSGRFGNNVRLVQEQLQRQGGSGNGGIRGGGRMSDEHSQEEMMRSYFPGWF